MIPQLVKGSGFRPKKIRDCQIGSSNGNVNSKTSRLEQLNSSSNMDKVGNSHINMFGKRDAV